MAKATKPLPDSVKEPAKTEADTEQQKAAAAAEQQKAAEEKTAEQSRELARQQADAIAAGESGQEQAKAASEARQANDAGTNGLTTTGHTITAPKDAPVDYSAKSHRRPNQRVLSAEHMSSDAMPHGPVVSLPFGSEPASFDPATGVAPAPKPDSAEVEAAHHDDTDADTDRGSSAAERAGRAAS